MSLLLCVQAHWVFFDSNSCQLRYYMYTFSCSLFIPYMEHKNKKQTLGIFFCDAHNLMLRWSILTYTCLLYAHIFNWTNFTGFVDTTSRHSHTDGGDIHIYNRSTFPDDISSQHKRVDATNKMGAKARRRRLRVSSVNAAHQKLLRLAERRRYDQYRTRLCTGYCS